MDRIKTLTLFAATALLAASCVKDEPTCDACGDISRGTGINLTFTTGIETRSELTSSEIDYKDVDDVYLYGFTGADGDATCFLVKDLDWVNEDKDSNQEEPNPQHFWISTDLPEGDLTFLAVGVDDNAGGVYGFPGGITVGSTLSNCLAKLANGNGKEAMRTAQFFSGYTTTNAGGESVIDVEITLTRRVTGVLTYLSNIPYTVNFSDANSGKAQVTDVRLVLASPQNTQMKLWPAATDNAPVYGETPLPADEENKVLFSVNLAGAGYQSDAKERYYTKDALTGEVTTLPNTLLTGAYLLPMNITSGNTLQLQLLGTYTDRDGVEHTDKVVKTYTINNSQGEPTFSLEENYLYSIGKKLSDGSTNGDKPADLSGNILQVEVTGWHEHEIPNDFPTVTAPARVSSAEKINPEKYIFDAPGTTTKVIVFPATPTAAPWKMTISYDLEEDAPNYALNHDQKDWIHIVAKNEENNSVEYVTELTNDGTKEVTVELILNDFAVQRKLTSPTPGNYDYLDEDIEMAKNDYRTAYIVITTTGQNESAPYKMRIRQYNTLSIYTGTDSQNGDSWTGTSRLDYGCTFDPETGEAYCVETSNTADNWDTGNTLNHWGYTGSINSNIVGETGDMDSNDGEDNTKRAMENKYGSKNFGGSMMWKANKEIIYIKDGQKQDTEVHIWYLPAYQEMAAINNYLRGTGKEATWKLFNFGWTNKYYWTSTGKGASFDTYYVELGGDNPHRAIDRDEYLAARPVRKFLNKDKLTGE